MIGLAQCLNDHIGDGLIALGAVLHIVHIAGGEEGIIMFAVQLQAIRCRGLQALHAHPVHGIADSPMHNHRYNS